MNSNSELRKLRDIAKLVVQRESVANASLGQYVSTETMGRNLGGITPATQMPPKGSVVKFQEGDVLFSNIRTYFRKVWHAEFSGTCSTDVLVFRTKDPDVLSQDYLYWILASQEFVDYSHQTSKGAKMPRGDKAALAAYEVKLPDIFEQIRIASFLNAIAGRISVSRRQNKNLEAMALALYKSWFVDYDPVVAKSKGLRPDALGDAIAALFPASFEVTESGDKIPSGWSRVTVGDLVSHTIGGDWGSAEPTSDNSQQVVILRGTDLPDLKFDGDIRAPVRYTTPAKLASRQLKDGDIVLEVSGGSKTQSTGRSLYITAELLARFDSPVVPASFCRRLRPNSKDNSLLLSLHLTYLYGQEKMWKYQNQSTGIANFQTPHFLETELITLPPPAVLAKFTSLIGAISQRVSGASIDELKSIRDAILSPLISGHLRIPDTTTTHA